MVKVTLRDATPADLPTLKAINAQAGTVVPDDDFEANPPGVVLEVKGDVVGFYWDMVGEGNLRYVMTPTLVPANKDKLLKPFVKALKKRAKAGAGVYKHLQVSVQVPDDDSAMKALLAGQGFEESGSVTTRGKKRVQYQFSP